MIKDEKYWQRHQGIEACQQECVGKVREKYEKSTRNVREKYEKSTLILREYMSICLRQERSIRINEDSLVVSEFVRGLRYGSSRSVR